MSEPSHLHAAMASPSLLDQPAPFFVPESNLWLPAGLHKNQEDPNDVLVLAKQTENNPNRR